MPGYFRVVLVVGLLIARPAIGAAQRHGGGSVLASPPASGSGRSSGPGRPAIAAAPARPAPPPFEARMAIQRQPLRGVRLSSFILWYGYFYSSWLDDLMISGVPDSSAVSPLAPPPDGVPTGGLQLDVEPHRAQVYVDGFYAGVTDNFRGYYHHLDLSAGRHRVDLLLSGYPPHTLDVVVTPGRTATYRGTLGSSVTKVD